jgi:hypothetical protein
MANEIDTLAARVTAIQIIVENMLADNLAQDSDPRLIGEEMVKSAFGTEEKVRRQFGDDDTAVRITEALSSMIDRAVKRAIDQRQRRGHASRRGKGH